MSEINEIKSVLTFLEKKFEVEFQLKILEEEKHEKGEDNIDELKGCFSSTHNTKKLATYYFYKKTY